MPILWADSPEYSPRLPTLRLPLLKAKALHTEIRDQRPIRNLLSFMFYSSKITSLRYLRTMLLNSSSRDSKPPLLTSFRCSKHTWLSTSAKYQYFVNWIRCAESRENLKQCRTMGNKQYRTMDNNHSLKLHFPTSQCKTNSVQIGLHIFLDCHM